MAVTPPRSGQMLAPHALGLFPAGGAAGAPLVFAEPSPVGQDDHDPVPENPVAALTPPSGSVGAPLGMSLVDALDSTVDGTVAPAAEEANGDEEALVAGGNGNKQACAAAGDLAVLKPAAAADGGTSLEAVHAAAGGDGGLLTARKADAAGLIGVQGGASMHGPAPAGSGSGCVAGSPAGERWAPKPATPLGGAKTLPPAMVRAPSAFL